MASQLDVSRQEEDGGRQRMADGDGDIIRMQHTMLRFGFI